MFIDISLLKVASLETKTVGQNKTVQKVFVSPTPLQSTPTPTVVPVQQGINTALPVSAKEYFIPLGTGTITAGDWVDVPGAQATIDTASYSNIKTVAFEVSLTIPTANQAASVRLFNTTDKHPVWLSELGISGGQSSSYLSAPILLEQGNKLYQVQAKTQLGSPLNIVQSRMHITTN